MQELMRGQKGLESAKGGVVAAKGFVCAGVACGLKAAGCKDLAIVASDSGPVPAAACFTGNIMAAAPVTVSREHIASGTCAAVVINSGGANACTGAQGIADARSMAAAVAERLGQAPTDVLVCSTGVIGAFLPMKNVLSGITEACEALGSADGTAAAEAIMTTDTFAKQAAVSVPVDGGCYTVGGMAKGSGMIAPDMATMLSVITTDAPLTPETCSAVLKRAVSSTFNRLTIDSDTSTNDTVVLMASGKAKGPVITKGDPRLSVIEDAVLEVCSALVRLLARDGEGATKLVTVTVAGALSEEAAEQAARTVADSPLVKTAVFGQDANWGRVAMAVGRSGVPFDPDDLSIAFAGIAVCEKGVSVPFDEEEAAVALAEDEIEISVSIGTGGYAAKVFTCDLTHGYVQINGDYRT